MLLLKNFLRTSKERIKSIENILNDFKVVVEFFEPLNSWSNQIGKIMLLLLLLLLALTLTPWNAHSLINSKGKYHVP